MNWKKEAISDLQNYRENKESLTNLRERIQALKEKADGLKAIAADRVPVKGGASKMEDRLIDNIAERERLKHTYLATKRLVGLVERGLTVLNEEEKTVLSTLYIEPRSKGAVETLCGIIGCEKATVYRIRDNALYHFTKSLYGMLDY
ncbi:MAG: hypothetical protein IKI29_01920 [Clostridia bacterium]|nr:hypothetical protein [Clostridia bacterium]